MCVITCVWVTCVFSHVYKAQSDDVSGLVIGGNNRITVVPLIPSAIRQKDTFYHKCCSTINNCHARCNQITSKSHQQGNESLFREDSPVIKMNYLCQTNLYFRTTVDLNPVSQDDDAMLSLRLLLLFQFNKYS